MVKVSVIIPTYNALAYLPQTIDSVRQQTFSDWEILLVDDGSTDGTAAWAEALGEPRLRYLSQPNQGCATARNRGLDHAQGEYVAFLDSDDLWHPTKLARQVAYLDSHPERGWVHTWVLNTDAEGRLTQHLLASDLEGFVWPQIAEENLVFCGSSPLLRRSCFETVGQFDPALKSAEDWDMWVRIATRYSLGVIREPLTFYRQRPSSKSNRLAFHLEHRLRVIDKSLGDLGPEFEDLRQRAKGRAYLSVAWKPLLTEDYDQALALRRQALAYYPGLRFSRNYVRLGLIVRGRQWLGRAGYEQVLGAWRSLRRWGRSPHSRESAPAAPAAAQPASK